MPSGSPSPSTIPEAIGVVGVGTIASAIVRGWCTPGLAVPPPRKFVLSPRGADKAKVLAAEFPEKVTVAGSNQEVVDASDCVVIAVLGPQVEEVLRSLTFRTGQKVLSLVAALGLERLQELVAPATECVIAVPLPAVAKRRGATLAYPRRPFAEAVFSPLGSCVSMEDEAQFKRMQCLNTLMGDFYKRQLTAQRWLVANGVGQAEAAAFTGAIFATIAADSSALGPNTLEHLLAEQTPGGLNEMVWKDQEADGNYRAIEHSLESVHHRLVRGRADPELAPAAKRVKTMPTETS